MKHLQCLFSPKPSSCDFSIVAFSGWKTQSKFSGSCLGVDVRGLREVRDCLPCTCHCVQFHKIHVIYSSPRSAWLSYKLEIFSVHPSLHTMSPLLMNSSTLSSKSANSSQEKQKLGVISTHSPEMAVLPIISFTFYFHSALKDISSVPTLPKCLTLVFLLTTYSTFPERSSGKFNFSSDYYYYYLMWSGPNLYSR